MTVFFPSTKLPFLKLRIFTGPFLMGAEVGALLVDRTSTLLPNSVATKATISSMEVGQALWSPGKAGISHRCVHCHHHHIKADAHHLPYKSGHKEYVRVYNFPFERGRGSK